MLCKFINKNCLIITILSALIGAYFSKGIFTIKDSTYNNLSTFIFIAIFFIQGCQLSISSLRKIFTKPKLFILNFFFCFIFCPLIFFFICKIILGEEHFITIGLTLISCMGPTIVSGAIIIKNNKADHSLAIGLIIILSLLSIFTIPFSIKFLLGTNIHLDSSKLFLKIISLVFLPTLVGYLTKKIFPQITNFKKTFYYCPIIMLGILIFLAFLPYGDLLHKTSFASLVTCMIIALALHQFCLWISFFSCRYIIPSYPISGTSAICSTQKTLPLALVIWVDIFADSYPLVLLPLIIFHFTQLYSDTLALRFLEKRFNR